MTRNSPFKTAPDQIQATGKILHVFYSGSSRQGNIYTKFLFKPYAGHIMTVVAFGLQENEVSPHINKTVFLQLHQRKLGNVPVTILTGNIIPASALKAVDHV